MKAVTYITENTIMKFLYSPKKTFLEGFVKEWLRFDSGVYKDYGKYVRFLKVPIRDNVSELYILIQRKFLAQVLIGAAML